MTYSEPGVGHAAWKGARAPTARIVHPRASLSGLLFAAIVRDTRGVQLKAIDRYNCFPASPLCSVTWILDGSLHLVEPNGAIDPAALPAIYVSGPFQHPLVSWSEGPVHAMTLGIYPDGWSALVGGDSSALVDQRQPLEAALSGEILDIFRGVPESGDCLEGFLGLQARLDPIWRQVHPGDHMTSRRIEDWMHSLAARAATSGAGKSARQIQRRIRTWTGQTQRQLRAYSRVENLFAHVRETGAVDLAEVAAEAGYADQSHMGREVRRLTGESPARIRRLIETEERYWCYRLLGEAV